MNKATMPGTPAIYFPAPNLIDPVLNSPFIFFTS